METVELYFDGIAKQCERKADRNGEVLFEAEDGSFVKFPSIENLEEMIEAHNSANQHPVQYAMPNDNFEVINNVVEED